MKRLFAIILTAALLCGVVPLAVSAAEPVDITADFTDPLFLEIVYSRLLYKPATEPIYDTDVAQIDRVHVSGKGISSLAGLEHFTGMTHLICEDNQLTSLPILPESLRSLHCEGNYLTDFVLPSGLSILYCDYNKLTTLPALPASLTFLSCTNNGMTALSALPSSLTELRCENNRLTALPTLPSSLSVLRCENNRLTALPVLPSGLKSLHCANNQLTGFDITGLSLTYLDCRNNSIIDEHNVTGFDGMWGQRDAERPDAMFYYYPQNVMQQNTNCEHGHHMVTCIAANQFPFEGDGDPPTYGNIQYQICKNKCGTIINKNNHISALAVLYRNNLTLPPPDEDMADLNFRYEVTKGAQYIEVVQRNDGGWEIRSKKNFLKITTDSQISVVTDAGSFVVANVDVYLRWFTWDWFKTYFLFGWIWF